MKTKITLIISAMLFLVLSACDKQLNLQHKYHGTWEMTKYEYYTSSGGGNYTLTTSHTTSSDSTKSYFLLYDRMDNLDNYNLCAYKMPPGVSSALIAGLGASGYSWWYSKSKGSIIFFDAGTAEYTVTIEDFSSKKMTFSYSDGTVKETFFMERADV
jgi:hypothetical protein